jgi:hypothetical protein
MRAEQLGPVRECRRCAPADTLLKIQQWVVMIVPVSADGVMGADGVSLTLIRS